MNHASAPLARHDDQLSGWGRLFQPGKELLSEDLRSLTNGAALSRGLGRSYGDSALPAPGTLEVAGTRLADRILGFDETTGRLHVEAGISLRALNDIFLPRRWFVPVSPGTSYVTVGGMIAADVHGKNHHVAGCFGAHVQRMILRVASGELVECSAETHPDLFFATIGGMGLTGHILEAEFTMSRIPSPWIQQETQRYGDIDALIGGLKEAAQAWPMTMAWIDCLQQGAGMGRGILYRGRWADPQDAPSDVPRNYKTLTAPFEPPSWLLNNLTMRAFNFLLFHKHGGRIKRGIVHPEAFWYPLDRVKRWNLLYGPRGFTQYQCVLPESAGAGAARRFLEVMTSRGNATFLCVIKDCGAQGHGVLSFPMSGISIALDIPVRDNTPALVAALNEATLAEGGRIYLAKDRFTTAEHYAAMDPRLARFQAIRDKWDPQRRLRSAQSARLFGDTTVGRASS